MYNLQDPFADARRELHVISLGAGVQSSTMALMAARGVITPMPDAAIFADTQAEPPSVYAWLDQLEKWLPFPVHRVSAGSLTVESTRLRERMDGTGSYVRQAIPGFVEKDGKASILVRGCTRDFKIRPITTAARRLKRVAHAERIVQWYGISVDESDRMKEPDEHDFLGRWPLIEKLMSRVDCLAWMQANGYPRPPRSSCAYCPFHSDAEWTRLKFEEPTAFAAAVDYERTLQVQLLKSTKPTLTCGTIYLHQSLQPLDQVDFGDAEGHFDNECAGHCGV